MRTLHPAAPIAAALAALLLAALPTEPMRAVEPTVVVEPGDTLIGIAGRHGVTVEQIVALNGLTDPDRILVGQVLQIVAPGSQPAADAEQSGAAPVESSPPQASAEPPAGAPAPAEPTVAGAQRSHPVKPGEHLTGIALLYGTTVRELVALNGILDPSFILAGQTLAVPPAPAAAAPGAGAWTDYVVRPGEHLIGIASAHGTTVAALAAANGLANPSLIFAGSTIRVPAPPSAEAAATAPAPPPQADSGTAPASLPEWMIPLVAQRDDVRRLIVASANEFGVPAPFALSVAWQESGWQQSVVSGSGAVGVMQLLPSTGEWVAGSILGAPVDVSDTASNVRAGVRLLRHYLDRYGGNKDLALAAYYQGQAATDLHGIYDVTRPYIASILFHERFFAG